MKGMFARLSVRQVVYMALIVALLLPLSMLSQPASADRARNPGGQLAQLRSTYKLGDSNIGQIDVRSQVVRLASLGLTGFANLILNVQADEYKTAEDWTRYRAALDQLIYLSPYYPKVWENQAWNLSYNLAAEFDDVHDKYYWIMNGVQLLQRGTTYLDDNPRLLWYTGWVVTNKVGRADERVQLRKMFAVDEDFHKQQRVQQRDNWLFGREYYLLAQDAVDTRGARMNSMDPLIFNFFPIQPQMFSADALVSDHQLELEAVMAAYPSASPERKQRLAEIDGKYLQMIRARWAIALRELREFGDRPFVAETGTIFRLSDKAETQRQLEESIAKLDGISPGLRKRLRDERFAKLPLEKKSALAAAAKTRTTEQERLAEEAEAELTVTDEDLAAGVDADKRDEATKLVADIHDLREKNFRILKAREHLIHYDYWISRAEVEQLEEAREAYRHLAHGAVAYKIDADPAQAKRELEQGFVHWRKVLDKYPMMLNDQTATAIDQSVKLYAQTLQQLDEPFPKDFILKDLVEAVGNDEPVKE